MVCEIKFTADEVLLFHSLIRYGEANHLLLKCQSARGETALSEKSHWLSGYSNDGNAVFPEPVYREDEEPIKTSTSALRSRAKMLIYSV
jgi:hypothetical protein